MTLSSRSKLLMNCLFKRSKNLEETLCDWLTRSLAEPTNKATVAYCVNLYDSPFRADLIGSGRFNAEDEDWACEEVWTPKDRHVNLPDKYASLPWEERLELCTDILQRYLTSETPGAKILRDAQAVAVGFVDGNLNIVSNKAANE